MAGGWGWSENTLARSSVGNVEGWASTLGLFLESKNRVTKLKAKSLK